MLTTTIYDAVSLQKPREASNTQAAGAQVPESPSTLSKTNSIPPTAGRTSTQHKYSIPANGDEQANNNTDQLARKVIGNGSPPWERPLPSPDDSRSRSDSWVSEDGRALPDKSSFKRKGNSHNTRKYKAYETKHRTKPYCHDARTGQPANPGVSRVRPGASHTLVEDRLPLHCSQAYSADMLRRLQRLEELQHGRTVEAPVEVRPYM